MGADEGDGGVEDLLLNLGFLAHTLAALETMADDSVDGF